VFVGARRPYQPFVRVPLATTVPLQLLRRPSALALSPQQKPSSESSSGSDDDDGGGDNDDQQQADEAATFLGFPKQAWRNMPYLMANLLGRLVALWGVDAMTRSCLHFNIRDVELALFRDMFFLAHRWRSGRK